MKQISILSLAAVIAFVGVTAVSADDDEPKYTTKQVMTKVFKGKTALLPKVAGGNATDDEKATTLEYLKALAANSPKKGDAESWKMKTAALVKAAENVVAGKDGSGAALKDAANCKACHTPHK